MTLSGGTALRMTADNVVYISSASQTATVATAISEDGSARALYKSGSGTLILSTDNAFTGEAAIYAGTVHLAHTNAVDA